MTDAPEKIWAVPYHGWASGNSGEFTTSQTNDNEYELAYVRADLLEAQAALIAEAREALAWYATKVGGCNRFGREGDTIRAELASDSGRRASSVLGKIEEAINA